MARNRGTLEQKNRFLIELKGRTWARNVADNRTIYRERGRSVGDLCGILRDKPVLLLGPGPSLDLVMPMLGHTYERMPVMACNSALNPLAAHGIAPDVIVILDAEPTIPRQIEEYIAFVPEESRKDSALVISALADAGSARAWPHELYYYGQAEETTETSRIFFKTLMDGWSRDDGDGEPVATIPNASCVFCTMVQLAYYMGAIPILSAGFDLPLEPGANYAATRYDLSVNPPVPTKEQIRDVEPKIIAAHRQYISSLLDVLTVHGLGFVNLSPLASYRGLVTTLPPNTLLTGTFRAPPDMALPAKE